MLQTNIIEKLIIFLAQNIIAISNQKKKKSVICMSTKKLIQPLKWIIYMHKKITYQDQLKMQLQEPPTIVQTGNISKSPQHAAETLHEHHFIQESK